MNDSNSVFGKKVSRKEALEGTAPFKITVRQDPAEMYRQSPAFYNNLHVFDHSNAIPHLRCINPRCQQGGLAIEKLIFYLPDCVEKRFHCDGHEGTPKGRRIGNPCLNSFIVTKESGNFTE